MVTNMEPAPVPATSCTALPPAGRRAAQMLELLCMAFVNDDLKVAPSQAMAS